MRVGSAAVTHNRAPHPVAEPARRACPVPRKCGRSHKAPARVANAHGRDGSAAFTMSGCIDCRAARRRRRRSSGPTGMAPPWKPTSCSSAGKAGASGDDPRTPALRAAQSKAQRRTPSRISCNRCMCTNADHNHHPRSYTGPDSDSQRHPSPGPSLDLTQTLMRSNPHVCKSRQPAFTRSVRRARRSASPTGTCVRSACPSRAQVGRPGLPPARVPGDVRPAVPARRLRQRLPRGRGGGPPACGCRQLDADARGLVQRPRRRCAAEGWDQGLGLSPGFMVDLGSKVVMRGEGRG